MPAPMTAAPTTHDEARRELLRLAHRRTGSLPETAVVDHVLRVTADGDWPVRRACLEAVVRRFAAARRDGLSVSARPAGGLGLYRTRGEDKAARPYRTLVSALSPLVGSCDCRDFLRNSLGLCKHLVVAFEDALAKTRRPAAAEAVPRVVWDPVRPLTGRGDWLERVSLAGESTSAAARHLFARGALSIPAEASRRLALVRGLRRLAAALDEASPRLPSDTALWPLLDAEERRLTHEREHAAIARRVPRLVAGLRHRLYPYQLEGVQRAIARGSLLLADDMGLGKTAQAIAACHALFRAGRVRRGLLIVPASLKPQWQREWQSFTDVPVALVDGGPAERAAAYRRTPKGFLVANYEQAVRDLGLMSAWKPDVVVLDEAQRIKNWATKTAASVKRLSPKYRLVLTGTPMENRLDELASLFDWVDDQALEPKWRLGPAHAMLDDGRREQIGVRHLSTIRERIGPAFVRRRKLEVLDQLPSRTDTRVPVELTAPQRAAHEEYDPPIRRLLSKARTRPLTQAEFLRLMSMLTMQRMICNGLALSAWDETAPALERRRPTEALLETLSTPKLGELRELVRALAVDQERKIVVFSQWRRMLSLSHWAIGDLLDAAGLRAVFFTGEESPSRRTQNVVDFHDDPSVRIFFATDAGGVGLNLQRAASCVVNLELPWNPAVLEQRIGRVYRLGQKRPIEVYNLVCEEGIEARIAGLVADKKAAFTGLFDGTSDEVRFEGSASFLAKVEQLVETPPAPVVAATEETLDDPDPAVDAAVPPEPPSIAPGPAAIASAAPPVAAAPNGAPAGGVGALLDAVRMTRRPDGGLTLEAPPEAAETLAAIFAGMARLLGRP